ncbi:MAG: hypothetical protein JST35_03085 [Armatimonadetes bacterium]|nr:hypothetical protein [Armatimonadota bacterium]
MGGRIAQIAVYNARPSLFYVATASGGLWKTDNGGITMAPVFDREGSISLGAVAVDQSNPDNVWVGTGEQHSRNSTAWGDGVYHSTDGGKTWMKVGLENTRHISSIVLDPKDKNHVYVGALGRLWGPSEDRGVYETTDGGKTWKKILYVNNLTGVINLIMHPKDPKTMIASMWERERKAYDFRSGGPGSGIFRTTDGGKTWKTSEKGLPNGTRGRIGLNYFLADPKVVIASVEYREKAAAPGATPPPARTQPNGSMFNGGGLYISKDGGVSWSFLNDLNPRPFYFSTPRLDPVDPKRIYVLGVSLHASEDAGKTFRAMRASIHADNHDMWIDPNDPTHMIIGNDGGLYQTRDRGVNWEHINKMAIGQFYAVAVDNRRPYWVYGGLQDNGSWGIPTQTNRGGPSFWDAVNVGGGDGFHVQVDPNDPMTLYSESQGGAMMRYDLKTNQSRFIRPRLDGERLRFNWSTPIYLSPHNSRTLYVGANRLFKSVNRGDAWKVISPDLTTNNPDKQRPGVNSVTPEDTGAERHCTIITISESPTKQGVLAVGTDDGLVWISEDDGTKWTNVTANIPDLPANTWCSRVLLSKHSQNRIYATFDGHRSNDFKAYAYVSEDLGKTWSKISDGLAEYDSVYVIREGEKNPDLLYLGSEMGLRVSLDRGKTWGRVRGNFPTVAVHDMVVHPRELDLVIATHGRSMWTIDVNGLEGLTSANRDKAVAVMQPQAVLNLVDFGSGWDGDAVYQARNTQPGTTIFYWLKAAAGSVKITISDAAGVRKAEITGTKNAGLNGVRWNGRLGGRGAPEPGEYRVSVVVDGKETLTSVRVETPDN